MSASFQDAERGQAWADALPDRAPHSAKIILHPVMPDMPELPPLEAYADEPMVDHGSPPAAVDGRSNQPELLPYRRASDVVVRTECDHVVKGLIGRARLVTVVGAPGAGKSALIGSIICAVVTGRPWNGHRARKGGALWLQLEGQAGGELRLAALRAHGDLPADAPLYIVTVPVSLLTDARRIAATALAVATDSGVQILLVVVDTLSRALSGSNENEGEVMTAAVGACDLIRDETGAAMVLVHHFGKNADNGARGHSSLNGAHDVQIDVIRNGDDRRAIVKKNRDGEEGREYPFKLEVVDLGVDDEGDRITSIVAVPTEGGQLAPIRAVETQRREDPRSIRRVVPD